MDDPALQLTLWCLRAALAAVFVFMGIAHFLPKPARGMAAMIPPTLRRRGIPSPRFLVRFTGLCEIAGGIGLLVPATRFAAGIALVLFRVAVFPANTYAAQHPEKFGAAAIPFWPRYAGQLVIIALVLLASVV
ncbi:DoxX family membrane protein [Glaciihabitans sp. dw_435]|uniref:DoxX family protein n=1 Tax=Glaciihabitans sp. dw_435 TaxID=2720081 RepID=UPI001BD46F80|nr:DoxX family membrane protein [Glaciihabitans sp. dw_435]